MHMACILCFIFSLNLTAAPIDKMTHLLASVPQAPELVHGSDNNYHVIYELIVSNFSKTPQTISSLAVQDTSSNKTIKTLNQQEFSARVQAFGDKQNKSQLASGESATIYVHLSFKNKAEVPKQVHHEFVLGSDKDTVREQIGATAILDKEPILIGPPLKGANYIAADTCCDSTRHIRAALPINGKITHSQRFAIDYEQLSEEGRIYSGPKTSLSSFVIYGKEAIAVADAVVMRAVNNAPEAAAGAFPPGITLETADGNSVVLKIAPDVYALYAHMQPGSVRVNVGDKVKKGQVLGLVGNSGNSLAPHLHFHLMNHDSPLKASGLPYVIENFTLSGKINSTADFDQAESSGNPAALTKLSTPQTISQKFPMDQSIVSF